MLQEKGGSKKSEIPQSLMTKHGHACAISFQFAPTKSCVDAYELVRIVLL